MSARSTLEAHRELLDGLFETTLELKREADSRDLSDLAEVANSVLFGALIQADLNALLWNLTGDSFSWNERMQCRFASIVVKESFDKLPAVLGGDFRRSLASLSISEGCLRELGLARSQLEDLKSRHLSVIKPLRDTVSAHSNRDAFAHLEQIRAIEPTEILNILLDLTRWNEMMLQVQNSIARELLASIRSSDAS